MNVAVGIPCYYLDDYLEAVKKQFPYESYVLARDFQEVPEEDVRNEILENLREFDYVFTVDGDEFILKKDQEKLLDLAKGHDAVFIPVINYTPDLKHRHKMSDHKPVVLVDPKKVEFYDGRCLRYTKPLVVEDVYLHHLGFTYNSTKRDWKKSRYWNKRNPKEYEQILNSEIEECELTEEIRSLIC
jgi:hypothetical protein